MYVLTIHVRYAVLQKKKDIAKTRYSHEYVIKNLNKYKVFAFIKI